RRHLGGGDGGGNLAFDVLKHDVADVTGLFGLPVALGVPRYQGEEAVVPVVDPLPLVHFGHVVRVGVVAVRQALLPAGQLLRDGVVFLLHGVSYLDGSPHMRIMMSRSAWEALLKSSHMSSL